MGITSEQSHRDSATGAATVTSAVERGLFNAALEFYDAAVAVIDYQAPSRPRLRWEIEGLEAIRAAMLALERRIAIACRAGLSAEEIAAITRLERDVVELIVERQQTVDDQPR